MNASAAQQAGPTDRPPVPPDGRAPQARLQRELLQAVAGAADRRSAETAVARALQQHLHPLAMWIRRRGDDGQLGAPQSLLDSDDQGEAVWQLAGSELQQLGAEAAAGAARRQAAGPLAGHDLLVVPVLLPGRSPDVLLAVAPAAPGAQPTDQGELLLQLAALALTLWHTLQQARQLAANSQLQNQVVDLLCRLGGAGDLPHAATLLANQLCGAAQCEHVAVAECDSSGACRLLAVSGTARVDRHGELPRAYEAALDEAVAAGRAIVWSPQGPASDGASPHTAGVAAKALCHAAGSAALVAAPWLDEQGRPLGAWVMLGPDRLVSRTSLLAVDALQRAVLPLLRTLHSRRRHSGVRGRGAQLLARLKQRPTLLAVGLTLLAGLLLPWPYRIACHATLEPVTRRFVVAPYEGTLKQQLVKPGDLVEPGQLLARLDEREVRMQRQALENELSGAQKKYLAAHGQQDTASKQIAAEEVKRLQQELELLDHRLQNLEIRSPVGGVVVSGDLEQVEGAPLTQGQSLYEVSPLEEMFVEVLVPEHEVRHVRPGTPARIWLDAFPNSRWTGSVERIHPRAELKESQSVFVAEVRLDNSRLLLRPGMRGHVRLRGPVRPVAWILFHRAWEQLVSLIW